MLGEEPFFSWEIQGIWNFPTDDWGRVMILDNYAGWWQAAWPHFVEKHGEDSVKRFWEDYGRKKAQRERRKAIVGTAADWEPALGVFQFCTRDAAGQPKGMNAEFLAQWLYRAIREDRAQLNKLIDLIKTNKRVFELLEKVDGGDHSVETLHALYEPIEVPVSFKPSGKSGKRTKLRLCLGFADFVINEKRLPTKTQLINMAKLAGNTKQTSDRGDLGLGMLPKKVN